MTKARAPVESKKSEVSPAGLPPVPSTDVSATSFSFSKYLTRPKIDESKSGLTSRVLRIIEGEERPFGPVSQSERDQWNRERMQLLDDLHELRMEVRQMKGDHSNWVDDTEASVRRPCLVMPAEIELLPERAGLPDGTLTELELLRRENMDLRNMTKEEKHSKAREIMLKLRAEIESLRTDNEKLNAQVESLLRSRESLAVQQPPRDIMANLGPFPLQISESDRERVQRIIESEWKSDYLQSRHGGGEPIKDPFQRRRP